MGTGLSAKDIHVVQEAGDFGLSRETLRLKLGSKDFSIDSNENCGDPNLVRRYPERFLAHHGGFTLDMQLAADQIEDRVVIGEGKDVEISARIWLYGSEKTSTVCYILGKDGNWYIRTSEQAPKTEKGVNYWTMEEARLTNKSDIDMLKIHINSVKEKKYA